MADPAIQYEDGGPDTSVPARAGLTGSIPAGSSSYSDSPLASVDPQAKQGMESLLGGKIKADEAAFGETNAISRSILNDQKRQYDATAVQPGEFPKWDADQQAAKYRTDPLSSFGSLGSVFGMIASAFTHHPMQNAMEASAAAMNAIHAGDQRAYDQAHEAWKQNLDMTFKRHELERQHFEDGFKMFEANMQLGANQLKQNAVKFGDQKAMFLIDHEMWPEYFQMQAERAKVGEALRETRDTLDQRGFAGAMSDRLQKQVEEQYPEGTQERVGAMYNVARIRNQLNSKDFNTQEYGQWAAEFFSKEHRFPTADEINDHTTELARAKRGGASLNQQQADAVDARTEELIRAGAKLGAASTQAIQEVTRHPGLGANGTKPGTLADDRTKLDAAITTKHPDWSPERVIAERNRQMKQGKIDQAIVNQLEHYPGTDRSDLGDIPVARQTKLVSAFESGKNLEAIAKYVKENPDAIGLAAKVSQNMNLDAYQALVSKANAGDKDSAAALQSLQGQAESDFDKKADKQLTLTQAAKAKVLNKMLTTQAFADAAASGSRGGTIFLDKVFKELYDQSSSPGAFYSILEKRYDEANNVAEEYHLGFDRRNDKESMPFWNGKAAGYAGKSTGTAHVVTDSKGDKYRFIGTDYESQKRDKSKWQKVE